MKTALFFDVDGTLFDNDKQTIKENTIHAIKSLKNDNKYILGLATGRSKDQLDAINSLKDCFEIKVLINGAVAYHHEQFIYGLPMDPKDSEAVLRYANSIQVGIGFIGKDGHAISLIDDQVRSALRDYQMEIPEVDPLYYLNQDVYQIWVFADNRQVIQKFKDKFPGLKLFPWHKEGADIVHKAVSKGEAIKTIKKQFEIDKIICFDCEMYVEMIDIDYIGVCMGNSKSKALKESATFITDHIADDGLYNAIIKLNLM